MSEAVFSAQAAMSGATPNIRTATDQRPRLLRGMPASLTGSLLFQPETCSGGRQPTTWHLARKAL